MVTYRRTKQNDKWRYLKVLDSGQTVFMKDSRVPAEVFKKMNELDIPELKFDDQPDKKRCLFCDGPQAHQRVFEGRMVPLCDIHYYSKNVGQIAAELRETTKEAVFLEDDRTAKKKRRKQIHAS